jgi:hypothetical protein
VSSCVAESRRGGAVPGHRPHAVHGAVSAAQIADPAAQILPVGQLLLVLSGRCYLTARPLFSSVFWSAASEGAGETGGGAGAGAAGAPLPRRAAPSSVSYIIDLYAATRNTLLVK